METIIFNDHDGIDPHFGHSNCDGFENSRNTMDHHEPMNHPDEIQFHRNLAGGGPGAEIDYTVVSVGVMTLGLLLVVEFVRHAVDHAAIGRPFFKAVLEGVYSECK